VDVVFLPILALGTLTTIVGLAGLAILGPRQKRIANELRTMDSLRRRALVAKAQAHSRARD
jgi:hypothetical protein